MMPIQYIKRKNINRLSNTFTQQTTHKKRTKEIRTRTNRHANWYSIYKIDEINNKLQKFENHLKEKNKSEREREREKQRR